MSAAAWPREAFFSALGELRAWMRTAFAFLWRPRRFARAWSEGTESAMNPVGFFAGSLAAVTVLHQLDRFGPPWPTGTNPSVWHDLASAVGPYLHYLALGLLCHLFVRPRGGLRALSLSAGVALFAGGLASVLTAGVLDPLRLLWSIRAGSGGDAAFRPHMPLLAVVVIGGFLLFCTSLVRGLAGAHGVRVFRPALGVAAAWIIAGAAISLLHVPGEYGFRVTFQVGHDPAGKPFINVGLTI